MGFAPAGGFGRLAGGQVSSWKSPIDRDTFLFYTVNTKGQPVYEEALSHAFCIAHQPERVLVANESTTRKGGKYALPSFARANGHAFTSQFLG